jgi:ribosomal protein S4
MLVLNKYSINNIFFLNYYSQFKYNWLDPNDNICKTFDTNVNKNTNLEFTQFYLLNNFFVYNQIDILENIVSFKKDTGFFKKDNKFNSVVLHRLNFIKTHNFKNDLISVKSEYLENNFNDKDIYSYKFFKNFKVNNCINRYIDEEYEFDVRNIDPKQKYLLTLKKNRNIFKFFLKKKSLKQYKFNKIFKNILNKKIKFFLNILEFKLFMVLVKSGFFANFKDACFFIKSGYVIVNNAIVTDFNYILNLTNNIKIIYNKYYYFYFRKSLNDIIVNIGKYSSFLWKINKNKFNMNKQQPMQIPSWIARYIYFKDDVPKFLEIDYLSMTLIILYYPYEFLDLDFYNMKFVNLYFLRLYNWKYLT